MTTARNATQRAMIALCVLFGATSRGLTQDPWPTWQRTPTRLGRAVSIGPRTGTIAWSVAVDPSTGPVSLVGSTTMDAAGRVFVPHRKGVAAVDSRTHDVIWQFRTADGVAGAPAIHAGRVLFGDAADVFYCVDAVTGQEIWSEPAAPHPNFSCVVDSAGVVYYTSQNEVMYARRVEDGELLWTAAIGGSTGTSPALDELGQVFTGSENWGDWAAHRTSDGRRIWSTFVGYGNIGTGPVDLAAGQNGRVYVSTFSQRIYALDRLTGDIAWSHRTFETLIGAIAVGHDGTIYLGVACCDSSLIAVSPDGDELWRRDLGGGVNFAPIVDGEGVIYVCSNFWTGSSYIARVHAVLPDGTELWNKRMPDRTAPSPMLAPDGTLYIVCNDKRLYAFKDPPPETAPPGAPVTPKTIRRVPPP